MMSRLRTTKGHTLTLPPRRVSVGESAANEIPIAPGHGLAAVHFHLQPWESGHFLEDAGSGLNTLVNGQAVSWAPLKHGDIITAGDLSITYEAESGVPAPGFPAREPDATPGPPDAPPFEEPPVPPSWLPPAALLPPAPPGSWRARSPSASRSGRRSKILFIVVLLLSLTAAAIWRYLNG